MESYFEDMSPVEDAVGGAISFSLTGRRFRLGEVRQALMVLSAAFLQAWFQSTGAQKHEALISELNKTMDGLKIAYGKSRIAESYERKISSIPSSRRRVTDNESILSESLVAIINSELLSLLSSIEWDEVPMPRIVNVLDRNGVVLLQEDFTPWAGFLIGGASSGEFILGDKNRSFENEWGSQYEVFSVRKLYLKWYQTESGKWSVEARIK